MINLEFDKDFYYDLEVLKDISPSYFKKFKKKLLNHPNYDSLKSKFILNKEDFSIIHILDKIAKEEMKDLSEDEVFYYPLCNRDEIKRIFNPKSAKDYLLKVRADDIANNIRLT